MINEAASVATAIENGCHVCVGISITDSLCPYREYYPYFMELHARGVQPVIEATVIRTCRCGGVDHVCSPIACCLGSLGPLGLGQPWGKKGKDTGAALADWG